MCFCISLCQESLLEWKCATGWLLLFGLILEFFCFSVFLLMDLDFRLFLLFSIFSAFLGTFCDFLCRVELQGYRFDLDFPFKMNVENFISTDYWFKNVIKAPIKTKTSGAMHNRKIQYDHLQLLTTENIEISEIPKLFKVKYPKHQKPCKMLQTQWTKDNWGSTIHQLMAYSLIILII